MSFTPHLKSAVGESFRLKLGHVYSKFVITGNTTPSSITATSSNPMVGIYLESGTDSGAQATDDSGNGFGTLDVNADPLVFGIIVLCGDAAELYESLTRKISGDMTSATPTLCGASSSGITASSNIAVTVSVAGVDADANTNVQKLAQEFYYRKV